MGCVRIPSAIPDLTVTKMLNWFPVGGLRAGRKRACGKGLNACISPGSHCNAFYPKCLVSYNNFCRDCSSPYPGMQIQW